MNFGLFFYAKMCLSHDGYRLVIVGLVGCLTFPLMLPPGVSPLPNQGDDSDRVCVCVFLTPKNANRKRVLPPSYFLPHPSYHVPARSPLVPFLNGHFFLYFGIDDL